MEQRMRGGRERRRMVGVVDIELMKIQLWRVRWLEGGWRCGVVGGMKSVEGRFGCDIGMVHCK